MSIAHASVSSPAGAALRAAGPPPTLRRHAVGASASRRFVTIDGVRLAYDDVGAGPTIVCLHAIGHGAGDFARLAARLPRSPSRARARLAGAGLVRPGRRAADRRAAMPSCSRAFSRPSTPGRSCWSATRSAAASRSVMPRSIPSRCAASCSRTAPGSTAFDAVTRVACGLMARFFARRRRAARAGSRARSRAYYRIGAAAPAAAEQRARIVAAADEIAPRLARCMGALRRSPTPTSARSRRASRAPCSSPGRCATASSSSRRNRPGDRAFPAGSRRRVSRRSRAAARDARRVRGRGRALSRRPRLTQDAARSHRGRAGVSGPVLLRGSCQCGKVGFRVDSDTPYPFMYCYCSICRKTTGALTCNVMGKRDTLVVTGSATCGCTTR